MIELRTSEPVPLEVAEDGVIRVSGTRVQLEIIVRAYLDGATADQIAESYSSVPLADVYQVVAYYIRHREELKPYLAWREAEAETIRKWAEGRWPSEGLRDRLLARRIA